MTTPQRESAKYPWHDRPADRNARSTKRRKQSAPRRKPVTTEVVVSTEAIDLDAWLDRYLELLLEARGYEIPIG